jgi:ligand-binding SRPBCC domain-containing protein
MPPRHLRFESELSAPPDRVWAWAMSLDGITREMRPYMRMTVPRGARDLRDVSVELGKPLFRSWILLFGVVPIDRSDLTLIELSHGAGFVEESPMLSMRLWRHERTLAPRGSGTLLVDRLTFEPRVAPALVTWFIRGVFRHRHAVLRRAFA